MSGNRKVWNVCFCVNENGKVTGTTILQPSFTFNDYVSESLDKLDFHSVRQNYNFYSFVFDNPLKIPNKGDSTTYDKFLIDVIKSANFWGIEPIVISIKDADKCRKMGIEIGTDDNKELLCKNNTFQKDVIEFLKHKNEKLGFEIAIKKNPKMKVDKIETDTSYIEQQKRFRPKR